MTQDWKVEDQFYTVEKVRDQFDIKAKGWGPKRNLNKKIFNIYCTMENIDYKYLIK